MSNKELIENLISKKILITPDIINSFIKTDRAFFVLPQYKEEAYDDKPLPIGYGATISQPTTVAFMLEKLQPKPGDKILEIGTGSGYQTALLANIAGDKGKIYSIEYIPELKKFAEENLKRYFGNSKNKNIFLFVGDGKKGLKDYSSFDKIISTASGKEIPKQWKEQLKIGGRIVAPVGTDIVVLDKIGDNEFEEKKYPGFLFVELK